MGKAGNLLDLTSSCRKSAEHCANVSAILHRNNSELILFIDPNEESLLVVMEDASSLGPISVQAACIKESVALLEKEMIGN